MGEKNLIKNVAEEGLEPPARGLWFHCSNQLSYSAKSILIKYGKIEVKK